MTHRKTSSKPNGHAGPHGRTNGHVPASTERGGIPLLQDHAASDDARGATLAMDAISTTAPGTNCEAHAEAAPPPPNGHLHEATATKPDSERETEPIPGGEFPLPADPGDFVEEIHRRADLFEVWQRLLNHTDPKIQQRAVEKLTEMRYKGAASLADEPQQIVIDIDSAVARHAAEGARK
jgi:hypothetical protein